VQRAQLGPLVLQEQLGTLPLEPQVQLVWQVPLEPQGLQQLAFLPSALASWQLAFLPSGTQREALPLPEVRLLMSHL
jgi:hypothetical protein